MDRAIELIKAGKLRKVWRISGEHSNFTIWEAYSPEEFHTDISSLNLHPWMRLEVTSIIEHHSMKAYEEWEGTYPTI